MHNTIRTALPALVAGLAACSSGENTVPVVAYSGATVWDGTGAPALADATIFVADGRVHSITTAPEAPAGLDVIEEIDMSGRYILPGFINTHGHVSGLWADPEVTGTLERIRGDLELFARYGITTVNSLGDDFDVVAARDQASPTDPRARLEAAGPVITDTDPAAARASAEANADAGVDWLKLRVDDNLATTEKMPWDAVEAVLAVGRERDIPVATHLFYLDDARRLLEMGSGMVAHSVRDTDVDVEFIEQLDESGVCYVPTLTREVSTFVYSERPDFFDDDFFTRWAHPEQVAGASDPDFMARTAASPAAAGYREALEVAMRNVKALADAGARVAMGTDTGPAGRFPGYFEHMELWMMVDAGMTPEQALLSATGVAAGCLERADIGTLAPGAWADFVVYTENPLDDIRATRSLQRVFIAGAELR
jgi:imidazolonepropionase-like amidohydrolase